MKNLQLPLKTKWFEMTKAGIKTEDYIEITPYWVKRLCCESPLMMYLDGKAVVSVFCDALSLFKFKPFTTNTMTLGYPSSNDTERIIKFEHAGIEIRTGNPELGAEPNKLYFVIKHGKRL